MIIAVIDGMGGGIGAQIVTQLRQELPLLPVNQPHFEVVGIEVKMLARQINAAVQIIRQSLSQG
jgi:hypothetical protein